MICLEESSTVPAILEILSLSEKLFPAQSMSLFMAYIHNVKDKYFKESP